MLRKLNNQKGFTLVEILVVVIIVAILAAIAVPIYMRYVQRSRTAEPQAAINTLMKAFDVYRNQTGSTQGFTIEKALKEADLGKSTLKRWKFEVTGNPPKKFIATSTEDFPGGPDNQVWYDVEESAFHGWGVDQFVNPETEQLETDTE